MKKIFLILVMALISVAAFAQSRYAYVSNVEQKPDRAEVTVSAKADAFRQYPNGFMVGVRPANHLFDLTLLTDKAAKYVHLSKDEPSVRVIFWCDEKYTGKKACSRYDFVVVNP
ncbi:MAG: hypothetical protein IJE21_06755 [Alistipes sp.]|nr:hypothetical protein [Alistipes sp.]